MNDVETPEAHEPDIRQCVALVCVDFEPTGAVRAGWGDQRETHIQPGERLVGIPQRYCRWLLDSGRIEEVPSEPL